MSKITYTNKVDLTTSSVAANNKVVAADMNEIKSVVNTNDDSVGDVSTLTTTASTVVGAINEINAKATFTTLWTNPDSTVIFNEQSITLSSDDYNYLIFLYYNINSGNFRGISSTIVPKGEDALLSSMYFNDSTTVNVYTLRKATYNSDTQYSFSKAWFTSTDQAGSARDYNVFIIPYKVIGVKL